MNKAKIIFASDLAPIRGFSKIMKEEPEAVYGDLLPRLKQADYNIVNLESPLCCPDGLITKSGAAFSGEPEHIGALKAGNFKAVVCANNHTFDSGLQGFRMTCDLLAENNISKVGAGENISEARQELAFEVNGIRFALFAISEGEDMLGATEQSYGVRPWEVAKLAEDIRNAREKYDVILISAHCGLEYQPYPSYYVYEAFKLWSEAGADMIIGHHPHVPQGMTCFGKTPAYFSLGNFVFYQPVKFFHRKTGYFLEIEAVKNGTDTPIDAYDTVTWMAVGPLTEQSIAMGGRPVSFPDFTRGKWFRREPVLCKYCLDEVCEDLDTPIVPEE
jgi:poly-gamma-glutamate synthesis protein (capsule biosynthesis protein)